MRLDAPAKIGRRLIGDGRELMREGIDIGVAERGRNLADRQALRQELLGHGDPVLNAVLHGGEPEGLFELLAKGVVIDPALLGDLLRRKGGVFLQQKSGAKYGVMRAAVFNARDAEDLVNDGRERMIQLQGG